MNMNKLGRKIAGLVLAAGVALSVFAGTSLDAYAYTQTTGKVTSDNVKVRESASTTAKQVSSLKNGDSVDIVDESKDASGYVWYKIYVNKNEFGYVRSDLVSKAGGSSSSSGTTSNSSAASLPETAVTAVEQKSATIITDSVNVRSGAGTSYDSVGKATKGETVTITGEATGTDNKTWYKVTFGANSKEGFVRSDLVEISEAVAVEVTEGGEAPAEGGENAEVAEGGEATEEVSVESQQPAVSQDQGDGKYSLKYIAGDDGNSVWYLYDNEGGYRVVVDELIAAAQSAEAVNKLRKQVGTFKKVAIALGALSVVLLAAVLFLVLKLRDSLYYEEEEEEEYDRYDNRRKPDNSPARRPSRDEDEEESERPVRRSADRDREVRPVRRENRDVSEARPTRRSVEERTVRPSRRDPEDDMDARPSRRTERNEDVDVERPSRRSMRDADDRPSRRVSEDRQSASAKEEAPKRRARNFIGDDDDFEFEFLDLDD
ncbi:bacterial SH3 domain-containing protein [Butyrivibrio proteoclasticus B316]|uniref:Bacterial SH3 domain-containing protein n=2 Tax=Butyrivibrio proteoclasticus TaxID=43305 RepID=E0S1D8_BUTPB|nr:bacterial SH3 domain-containing protein [Butyrivibrio proteoclasticus B316]